MALLPGVVEGRLENPTEESPELNVEIRRLTAAVRDGKATPAELGSGAVPLNNYGVSGVVGSSAISNHP